MAHWYIEYGFAGEGTVVVEAASEEAARALVDNGDVPLVWDDAEVEINAVSYVRMHKPDVLRGATVAECVARKDSEPKGSLSLLAGVDTMVVIDTLATDDEGSKKIIDLLRQAQA